MEEQSGVPKLRQYLGRANALIGVPQFQRPVIFGLPVFVQIGDEHHFVVQRRLVMQIEIGMNLEHPAVSGFMQPAAKIMRIGDQIDHACDA